MSTTITMFDPWGQVAREADAGNVPEKSIALTYAIAIRDSPPAQLGIGDPIVIEVTPNGGSWCARSPSFPGLAAYRGDRDEAIGGLVALLPCVEIREVE